MLFSEWIKKFMLRNYMATLTILKIIEVPMKKYPHGTNCEIRFRLSNQFPQEYYSLHLKGDCEKTFSLKEIRYEKSKLLCKGKIPVNGFFSFDMTGEHPCDTPIDCLNLILHSFNIGLFRDRYSNPNCFQMSSLIEMEDCEI